MKDIADTTDTNGPNVNEIIGKSLFYGTGLKIDWVCARRNLERSTDDPESLLILGIIYQIGLGVKTDVRKSFTYYKRASAKGNAEAMFRLGNMYLNGTYVRKDECEAWKLINRAYALGFDPNRCDQ